MRILVADDDSILLKLLRGLLTKWGHDVLAVSDGFAAMAELEKPEHPQIAIVDWVMPGMDGIELCRKMRDRNNMDFIYFLLLTGKTEEKDIVEGLSSGANDYITKPIRTEELRSRIEVGIRTVQYEQKLQVFNKELKEKNDALEKYARVMESLAEERAKKLIHAERLSILGELSAGMAHEVNNYLSPVMGYLEMLSLRLSRMEIAEEQRAGINDCLSGIGVGADRIRKLIERIRSHSKANRDEKSILNINDVLNHSLELCISKLKKFTIEKNFATRLPIITANVQELEQVFVNIFKNAADSMEEMPMGANRIKIYTQSDDKRIYITIEDCGTGIPHEQIDKIFDSFFTTKSNEKGTGLGLSICKGIIEGYSGRIRVENRAEGGARFTIELPYRVK